MKRRLPLEGHGGAWTQELLLGVAEGERRAALRLLQGGIEGAFAAVEKACDRAEELQRAALAKSPPPSPIACSKGCSSCCMAKVVAIAPEVLRIADHLRKSLSPEDLSRVAARVRAADEQTRGRTRTERVTLGVPCPLLVDNACSMHPVRPLICRGWNSLDRGACERHFADPQAPVAPEYVPSYELASAVLAGLGQATLDSGRDGRLLELVAALRIALERDNAKERWNEGRHVFELAVDREPRQGE